MAAILRTAFQVTSSPHYGEFEKRGATPTTTSIVIPKYGVTIPNS